MLASDKCNFLALNPEAREHSEESDYLKGDEGYARARERGNVVVRFVASEVDLRFEGFRLLRRLLLTAVHQLLKIELSVPSN